MFDTVRIEPPDICIKTRASSVSSAATDFYIGADCKVVLAFLIK